VIHEMNSEEWVCGDDCLAVICVFVMYIGVMFVVMTYPSYLVIELR
jgi:hypothetical protein